MPKSGTLAVLLCNYNQGHFISQAIEAVLSQSRPPEQFIIVDDGSTDNSVEIVESYAKKAPCIEFLRLEKNTGAFPALQMGLQRVRGEYLYNASADDYVLPGFFEKAMRLAGRFPQAGFIVGRWRVIDMEDRLIVEPPLPRENYEGFLSPAEFRQLLLEQGAIDLGSTSALFRFDVLKAVGAWRRELGHYCDSFLALAIPLKSGICLIPEPCACWRRNPGGMSQTQSSRAVAGLGIIERAAALMQSDEFKDLFPVEWITRWKRETSERLITHRISEYRRLMNARYDPFIEQLYHGGGWRRRVSYALDAAARWRIEAGARRLERQFRAHQPGLSGVAE